MPKSAAMTVQLRPRYALFGLPVLGAVWMFACGGPDNMPPPPPPPPVPTTDAATTVSTVAPTNSAALVVKAPLPPVTLTVGAASPDPTGALPTVAITAPGKESVVP